MKRSNLIYIVTLFWGIVFLFNFSLKAQNPDIIVAKDGSGNYTTVQAAINAAPSNSSNRTEIHIKNGIYYELINIPSNKKNLTFIGESVEGTILTYNNGAKTINPATGSAYGTSGSTSILISGEGFYALNISFQNNADPSLGQAVAVKNQADKSVFKNCRFLGNQDTYYPNAGRSYHENCYIEGTTDFIFGGAIAFFENCQIYSKGGTSVTAASTAENVAFGYVFNNCTITGKGANITDLGRPWRPFASVTYMNSSISNCIKAVGWNNWNNPSNELTARFSEYNNTGAGANLSGRVSWMNKLTAAQAMEYNVLNVLKATNANPQVVDNWNPFVVLGRSASDISVSITSPDDKSNFAENSSITIIAEASVTNNKIANIKFYADSLLNQDNEAPYTYTWDNIKSGIHNIVVTATDTSGYTVYSKKITLYVGTGFIISSPSSGAKFRLPYDIQINTAAWDSEGPITKVEFFQGTSLLGVDSISPFSFTWKNVAPGTYTLTAKATRYNNSILTSNEVNVTMVGGPDGYAYCSAEKAACTINGVANVAFGADGKFNYKYNVTGKVDCTSAVFGDPIYGTAKACYVQLTTTPFATITMPKTGSSFIASENITITADAIDNDGTIASVEFFNGSTSLGIATSLPYSIIWENVAVGTFKITAKVTDNDGKTFTSEEVNITVTNKTNVIDLEDKAMLIYPNPVSDKVTLTLAPNFADQSSVVISSSNGAVVLKQNLSGTKHILNLESIPQGIYTICLSNKNGEVISKKIIKN